MTRFILVLISFLLLSFSALAQDEPLPESVATPYLAYQAAMEQGDGQMALEMAAQAYQAGRAARIDGAILGILAENHGARAAASGDNEAAYTSWRFAAETAEDVDASAIDRAWGWHNAARAAFLNGDGREARNCSTRAVRSLRDDPDALETEASLVGDINFLNARILVDTGSLRSINEPAARALEAYERAGRQPDAAIALTYFLKGLGSLGRSDWSDAAFEFHMSRDIYQAIEGSEADFFRGDALLSYAYQQASSRDKIDYETRINESAIHAQINALDDDEAGDLGTIDREGYVDAEVRGRRVSPRYPQGALNGRVEGVAIIRFDISEEGETENIELLAQVPGAIFGEVSVEAISEWRYNPATQDGHPVVREGVMTHFVFDIRN